MIDLNKIVNETLKNIEKEGFVEKVVEKRLKETMESVIDDTFRSYSDFGKNLKEYVGQNLNVNLSNLGLEGYNTLVLAAVKEELDKTITMQGIEKIKQTAEEMLSSVKDEYTLSELIEKVKEGFCKEEYEYDEYDKITLFIEDGSSGYKHIYLNEEEEDRKYSCDYQIDINKEGKPYSIKLKGDEIDSKKILGGLYGLDKLLFKIYAHGSKIILDQGEDPEDYDTQFREGY
ncbi:hypothetical protein [Clostridium algidicarnis]|uniref:hypothetical protein n=1 Tax=Clostridium algidicarnis TaxID=37659 RepID=UPI001C0BBFF2|nr:hypothetical protein [Clostridium algidicarnis]MBU3205169.1 hypothetical protein [Clostridium algidicarnis]MBU3213322.1 hypothetical protein [Clostridium algidicarnis]MBU3223783.1 hypothetical protein [Clostridium algidicarnis]